MPWRQDAAALAEILDEIFHRGRQIGFELLRVTGVLTAGRGARGTDGHNVSVALAGSREDDQPHQAHPYEMASRRR